MNYKEKVNLAANEVLPETFTMEDRYRLLKKFSVKRVANYFEGAKQTLYNFKWYIEGNGSVGSPNVSTLSKIDNAIREYKKAMINLAFELSIEDNKQ